jgi:hypothetical protein
MRSSPVLVVLGGGPHFEKGLLALLVALGHHGAAAVFLLELLARAAAKPVDFLGAEQSLANDVAVASIEARLFLGHRDHQPFS